MDFDPILDQLDFTIERAVDYRKNKWDVGFKAEIMWGADAGIIHSNGLFDWYDGIRKPENQWDLTQAYVDVTVPLGTGLRLRSSNSSQTAQQSSCRASRLKEQATS